MKRKERSKVEVALLAILLATGLSIMVSQEKKTYAATADILLTEGNLVVLNESVSEDSVSAAISDIISVEEDTVYLFLNSPGGSVFSGRRLIEFIKTASDKKINCIVQYAASMAFVITQACDKRFVLNSGILMQHQASYGLRNGPQKNQKSFIGLLERYLSEIDIMQAQRIGIPLEEFDKLTAHDLWLTAKDAVKMNAVDKIVSVSCSKSLSKAEDVVKFYAGEVVYSKCPLVTSPVRVNRHNRMGLFPNLKRAYNTLTASEIKTINRMNGE